MSELRSTVMESAWEPFESDWPIQCEHGFPFEKSQAQPCETTTTWQLRREQGESITQWNRRSQPIYTCDAHKVEPQPPEYSEWLAAQEIK